MTRRNLSADIDRRPGIRIIRNLVQRVPDHRDIDEQISDIEARGVHPTPDVMRKYIIAGLELRPPNWPATADNLIMLGCYSWGGASAIVSYCKILRRFDERFFFLPKEYCCGALGICHTFGKGTPADVEKADEASARFTGKNIDEARRLGARTMYHCCTWCAYLTRRFNTDTDMPQHLYLDHVVEVMERHKPLLQLDRRVAYFGGGQHRRTVYVPGITWNFDWAGYRGLLDRVAGLEIVDIPRHCCMTDGDKLANAVAAAKTDTLVTSCQACHQRMRSVVPQGVRVVSLTDILLQALDHNG